MSRTKVSVAIVDDDEAVRRALLRVLRSDGLECVDYGSGRDFLATLPCATPSCVILDIHMPGVSGLAVQQEIALRWPDLPVIMVTGHCTAATEATARAWLPAAFMVKPIDSDALVRAVRAATG